MSLSSVDSCGAIGSFAGIADFGPSQAGHQTSATATNGSGEIVVLEIDSTGATSTWRYSDATGSEPVTFAGASVSFGTAINSFGVITGFMSPGTIWTTTTAFRADPGAAGILISPAGSVSRAINNAGQITLTVGGRARRLTGTVSLDLGVPSGGRFSGVTDAFGIGPNGEVVGEASTNLASRDFADGTHFAPGGAIQESFLYKDGQGMRSLNDDPVVMASEWQLLSGAAATNGIQVTGWGLIHGVCHAYLYTVGAFIVDLGTLPGANAVGADACANTTSPKRYVGNAINSQG